MLHCGCMHVCGCHPAPVGSVIRDYLNLLTAVLAWLGKPLTNWQDYDPDRPPRGNQPVLMLWPSGAINLHETSDAWGGYVAGSRWRHVSEIMPGAES